MNFYTTIAVDTIGCVSFQQSSKVMSGVYVLAFGKFFPGLGSDDSHDSLTRKYKSGLGRQRQEAGNFLDNFHGEVEELELRGPQFGNVFWEEIFMDLLEAQGFHFGPKVCWPSSGCSSWHRIGSGRTDARRPRMTRKVGR